MNIGDVYERKDWQYKIVAKVDHETEEDTFVYLMVRRQFGSDTVEYYTQEYEFGNGYRKTDCWLGD